MSGEDTRQSSATQYPLDELQSILQKGLAKVGSAAVEVYNNLAAVARLSVQCGPAELNTQK